MIGKARTVAGVLALVWMCVIFAFSAQEKEESSAVSEAFSYRMVNSTGILFHLHLDEEELRQIAAAIEGGVRKAAHMTEFGILSVLVYVWLGKWALATGRKITIAALVATVYAASDEFHQLWVPGRAGTIGDVMIDGIGAVLGACIFVGVRKCIIFLWNRHRSKDIKS
ncbi:MAG: VanZ family protein [Lachnospiraceae bacterium]|nr:VanZ family protein [Lachnospiraceae bacterium]